MSKVETRAAEILEFQLSLLEDEELLGSIQEAIRDGYSAERAWTARIDEDIKAYSDSSDSILMARRDDLNDLRYRVLELLGSSHSKFREPNWAVPSIIIADNILPSQFLAMEREKVIGIALADGGANSHVAVLAKARSVPMLVGCGQRLLEERSARPAFLDADQGVIVFDPENDRVSAAAKRGTQEDTMPDQHSGSASRTKGGELVSIFANIDDLGLLDTILIDQFDGVGLVRSEFLLGAATLSDEDAQFGIYCRILDWSKGHPVTIRTLDAGGDKPMDGIGSDGDKNPLLGVRGYRASSANKQMFKIQLRALARAACRGDLQVMIPMVTVPQEMEDFRSLFKEVLVELRAEGVEVRSPPLGMMIETPSAALLADQFPADFFSIGSNDLAQYTAAVSRDVSELSDLVTKSRPALYALIQESVNAARKLNKEISICGDIAGDPDIVPELLRLGLRSFSVSPIHARRVRELASEWGFVSDE